MLWFAKLRCLKCHRWRILVTGRSSSLTAVCTAQIVCLRHAIKLYFTSLSNCLVYLCSLELFLLLDICVSNAEQSSAFINVALILASVICKQDCIIAESGILPPPGAVTARYPKNGLGVDFNPQEQLTPIQCTCVSVWVSPTPENWPVLKFELLARSYSPLHVIQMWPGDSVVTTRSANR